jgi:hypothetical protein
MTFRTCRSSSFMFPEESLWSAKTPSDFKINKIR